MIRGLRQGRRGVGIAAIALLLALIGAGSAWATSTVTLTSPANGSYTNNTEPAFSGVASPSGGTVTITITDQTNNTVPPVDLTATPNAAGAYSVKPSTALGDDTYTAQATQALSNPSTTNTFTIDTALPVVTLTGPANDSTTTSSRPAFTGTSDTTDPDALQPITVKLYAGTSSTGTPFETVTRNASGGIYSIQPPVALAPGTYTAVTAQSDKAGNTGSSAPTTFAIVTDLTERATSITDTKAELNGIIITGGQATTVNFIYAPGTTTPLTCPSSGTSTAAVKANFGSSPVFATASLGGLTPNTTYTFCVVLTMSTTGWSSPPDGTAVTFRTLAAPRPVPAFTPGVATVLAGSPVKFDGTPSSDADGKITAYSWHFGDNSNPSTDSRPTHTYFKTGIFTVTLAVTDSFGNKSTVTHKVTVIAPPPVQTLILTPVAAPALVKFATPWVNHFGRVGLGERLFCPGPGPGCRTTITATSSPVVRAGRAVIRTGPNRSTALTFRLSRRARTWLSRHGQLALKVKALTVRGQQRTASLLNLTVR